MKVLRVAMILSASLIVLHAHPLSAQERWVYRYNGPGNFEDIAHSIVVGPDSNLYAAGWSHGIGTQYDFVVVSLAPAGSERWAYRRNGSGNEWDCASSIAMGSDGNVYAAGWTCESTTGYDLTVVGLTPSGGERWVYRYNGPGNEEDEANAIVTGADGNLYVAGASHGSGTEYDFTVVSLDTSGAERWVYRYTGSGNYYDRAYSIVADEGGNLYAGGYSCGIGTSLDLTIISLTSAGTERWVWRHNGPGDGPDAIRSIVLGADGNLYGAGYNHGGGSNEDFAVVSVDTLGAERWVYTYNGPGNYLDHANSLVLGADSNLYAAGLITESGMTSDVIVISVTPAGAERWVYTYSGPGNGGDFAQSIVTGTDGNLYVAAWSSGSGTGWDFVVLSLDTSGTERWLYRYNGPGDDWDEANSIVAATDGNLYAAGGSTGLGTDKDLTVISLTPDVGVQENLEGRDKQPTYPGRGLRQARVEVSPIPLCSRSGATIRYSIAEPAHVRLAIYDVCGNLVTTLINSREQAGSKAVFWDRRDESGHVVSTRTYFCRLTAGDFSSTRKLVMLR